MDSPLSSQPLPASNQSILEEKRDLLARLLSRLAHEIRNPLSSLDIHVQLLEEDLAKLAPATESPLTRRLEIIRGELTRLENIVKRFLRLASPSALELETVDLPKVIDHVCELLRPEALARKIEILTRIDPALDPFTADGVQLTQALLNLLINALQAVSTEGQVEVDASRTRQEIRIAVHDSGPGIPLEKVAAVFEPYFTTKEEGSGLGLWIAQQIAVAHGGALRVSNAPEGGAVFTLCIPWRDAGGDGG